MFFECCYFFWVASSDNIEYEEPVKIASEEQKYYPTKEVEGKMITPLDIVSNFVMPSCLAYIIMDCCLPLECQASQNAMISI